MHPLNATRQQAIFELMGSEISYINDLKLVLDVYAFEKWKSVLSKEQHDEFIQPLFDMQQLHEPFSENLTYRQKNAKNGEGVFWLVCVCVCVYVCVCTCVCVCMCACVCV